MFFPDNRFKSRLLQSVAILATITAASSGTARAQTANTTASNVNLLNLLSPFLSLNSTTTGQTTLTTNLQQAIATNNSATLAQQQLAISDKSILNAASNNLSSVGLGTYGVAANLAGGLPAQTVDNGITPQQLVGGLGARLGPIYQTGVANGTSGPLAATVNLLTSAYNFTSTDLGIAKFYFANGTTNGTTTAIAPAGVTLPTFNGLPNTTNSVYDVAYGVKNTQSGQDIYGSSRPVQVTPTGINQFDPSALSGLSTNPSFPSGHTTYAYTDSLLLAMLVPQEYQSMLSRASEYANSRIVLGVHYPLDIIASRALASYDLAQAFTNPAYLNNATTTGTALNLPTLFAQAAPQIQSYLASQCGSTVATCAASTANTANDPYVASVANQALYTSRLTYGLPTLTFAQAPREAAPTGGPDASILLAPLYGGSTSVAAQIAPNGGLNGSLQTSTINQIIVNTETNALAAFYGTSLSYWTRIDLYSASTYFQNVTGTLSLAPSDLVTTDVTIGAGGVLSADGSITGQTTVASTGTLAGSGSVANVAINNGGILAPGSLASQTALLAGNTGVNGTKLTVNGALAFAAGSTFSIAATPTQATSVTATGAVTITGGTVAVQAPANASFVPFTAYTILTANGVTGTFAGATSTLPFLTASLSYDANDVFLTLNRNNISFAAAAATPNQTRVAQALTNGSTQVTTGNGGALLNAAFSQLTTTQAQATFNALSGEGIVTTQNTGIQAARVFSGAIADQATAWMTGGGATNAITLSALPSGAMQYTALAAPPSPIVVDKPVPQRTYRAWATGFGGGMTIAGTTNAAGETGNFYGGTVGLDYQVQPNILIGIAGGGSESTFSVNGRSTSGDVTGFHGGVYSLVEFGSFYGASTTTVSSFSNRTTRNVAGFGGLNTATEKASFGSIDVRTRAELGRVYDLGDTNGLSNVKVTPFVALEIAQLRSNGFSEYNAAAGANVVGLTAQGQTTADVPSFVGVRFESVYAAAGGMILHPMVSVAYLHEFAPQRTLQNSFLSLPGSAFLVSGARPSSNAAQTKIGLELDMGRGVGLFANFDGEFSGQEKVYGGKGGVRFTW